MGYYEYSVYRIYPAADWIKDKILLLSFIPPLDFGKEWPGTSFLYNLFLLNNDK
jgi:hypothetical protein